MHKELRWWEIKGIELLLSGVITAGIAFLFYRSVWAMVLWGVCYRLVRRFLRDYRIKKHKEELIEHFMTGLQILNTSLQVGLSMENAWREVETELLDLYGKDSAFYDAVRDINAKVEMNLPLEGVFYEYAKSCDTEELKRFADILVYGKRSGGNWKVIIEGTVGRMWERYETQKEIQVLLAEKQLEQKILSIVPLGMLAFLQLSAWDYIKVLYHNSFGIICMSICLLIYLLALGLSQKIMDIEV